MCKCRSTQKHTYEEHSLRSLARVCNMRSCAAPSLPPPFFSFPPSFPLSSSPFNILQCLHVARPNTAARNYTLAKSTLRVRFATSNAHCSLVFTDTNLNSHALSQKIRPLTAFSSITFTTVVPLRKNLSQSACIFHIILAIVQRFSLFQRPITG